MKIVLHVITEYAIDQFSELLVLLQHLVKGSAREAHRPVLSSFPFSFWRRDHNRACAAATDDVLPDVIRRAGTVVIPDELTALEPLDRGPVNNAAGSSAQATHARATGLLHTWK